jgi:hypothetical protein
VFVDVDGDVDGDVDVDVLCGCAMWMCYVNKTIINEYNCRFATRACCLNALTAEGPAEGVGHVRWIQMPNEI